MLLGEGVYFGVPLGGNWTKAKTGTPGVAIDVRLTHVLEEEDDRWTEIGPVERTIWLYMSEKARDRTREDMTALGFVESSFMDESLRFECPDGAEFTCRHEEWNGKVREKWSIGRGGPAERPTAPTDEVKRMKAWWSSQRKPAPAGRPAPAAAPARTPTPLVTEQDLIDADKPPF